MNYYEFKENAKHQISGNIGVFLLMYIAIYVIVGLLGIIPAVGPVLGFVAESVLGISMTLIFLALANGIVPEFTDLFEIFKNTRLCGNAILLNIITGIFVFLWSLLLVVPGIIKALSYSMAPYILAENDCLLTPSEALKESMRIMDGHKMDLFMFSLSFIGWWLLVIVTCGIASIYVAPYYTAAMTNFYNAIKDKPENNTVESVVLD